MVKECPVIVNNDAVTVVKFDGKEVQFSSINERDAKTLKVKLENGKYYIVDKHEENKKIDIDEFVNLVELSEDEEVPKKTIKRKNSKNED